MPAALEILETPPAPMRVTVMLTICAFFGLALIWSFFGQLDIHASAWGKIEASGRSKVIQPLEPGKVTTIAARDGAQVKAGDLLLALDDAEAKANASAAQEAYDAARAEADRRRASIAMAHALGRGEAAGRDPDFDAMTPERLRRREAAVYAADRAYLEDTLVNLSRQVEQREATLQKLQMSIDEQTLAIANAKDRVGVRESSIKLNVGTKINLFDAREALQRAQAQIASDRGQMIETRAAISELASQRAKAISQFVADNEAKLAEAERKAEGFSQEVAKADAKLARTRLVAPIDGVVQQMGVTTIGQVVSAGQQLMTLAPLDAALQVEVFVSNLDIGFVRVGQTAEVKVDAFPFTRFGTAPAKVTQVAADAIDEQEAKRRQSNVAAAPQAAGGASAQGQPQSFVFPVTLTLDRPTIDVYGRAAALTPGMTVTAEIKTDKRRVIDYLISPIAKISAEAMRER
ncbi:MAG: HlyD family type I secretion periplasmic adaptor subunit [Rhodoblastus sp.]|nr:MAG: HlyD family type I secretion periplasmic adaptor subunit [Rhodoblastus sp.]